VAEAFCQDPAGSPPRRAGNFSLTRQRKVTKRGALNAIRTRVGSSARFARSGWHPDANRCALAHHLGRASAIKPSRRLSRGCTPTPGSRNTEQPRRSGGAVLISLAGEHGVQPRVERPIGAMDGARDKSDARAKRFASCRNDSGCFRAPLMAASCWCAVQRLFFGDFLLAPQKKVTPLPGGTPGNAAMKRTAPPKQPQPRPRPISASSPSPTAPSAHPARSPTAPARPSHRRPPRHRPSAPGCAA
jgi:hypothetical protein